MKTTGQKRKPRRKPVRTTEALGLTLQPADIDLAKRGAARYGMTVSQYTATLYRGQTQVARPSLTTPELALIANRVSEALTALDREPADVSIAKYRLQDATRRIVELLRGELPAYDAAVKAQVREDFWGSTG